MRSRLAAYLIFGPVLTWWVACPSRVVRAEDAPAQPLVLEPSPIETPPASVEGAVPPPPVINKKGRSGVEENTEGSQAPNRFQADPVIKSRYSSGGEQLEVDPD